MNAVLLALFEVAAWLSAGLASRVCDAIATVFPTVTADDADAARAELRAALPTDAAAARRLAYRVIREICAVNVLAGRHFDDGVARLLGDGDGAAWCEPTEAQVAQICGSEAAWWEACAVGARHAAAGLHRFTGVTLQDCAERPRVALASSLVAAVASSWGSAVSRDQGLLLAAFMREEGPAVRTVIGVDDRCLAALEDGRASALLVPPAAVATRADLERLAALLKEAIGQAWQAGSEAAGPGVEMAVRAAAAVVRELLETAPASAPTPPAAVATRADLGRVLDAIGEVDDAISLHVGKPQRCHLEEANERAAAVVRELLRRAST